MAVLDGLASGSWNGQGDAMSDLQQQTSAPSGKPASKGCWFYGCITLVVLLVLGAVGAFFAVRYVARTVTAMVQQYSQPEPLKLPEIALSPEEKRDLKQRAEVFTTAMNSSKSDAHELSLSGDELTQLLADSDPSGLLAKAVRLRIEGSDLRGTISFPLEKLGLAQMGGRYLNGEGVFDISLQQGNLKVSLKELQIQGKPLPASALAPLRSANLADQFNADPKLRAKLDGFDSIQVKDGRLLVRSKSKP